MRRLGLILLLVGLAGFLFATSQAAAHPELPAYETARWLLVGAGVMGCVLTALPGPRR